MNGLVKVAVGSVILVLLAFVSILVNPTIAATKTSPTPAFTITMNLLVTTRKKIEQTLVRPPLKISNRVRRLDIDNLTMPVEIANLVVEKFREMQRAGQQPVVYDCLYQFTNLGKTTQSIFVTSRDNGERFSMRIPIDMSVVIVGPGQTVRRRCVVITTNGTETVLARIQDIYTPMKDNVFANFIAFKGPHSYTHDEVGKILDNHQEFQKFLKEVWANSWYYLWLE